MINEFSFGRIVVDDITFSSDIKIIEGKVISEWWRKSGHLVDIEDIQDIIEAKPDIVVIGKGSPGLMKTSSSMRKYLKNSGIKLIEEKTAKAIHTFNRLSLADEKVVAGFHVGC